MDFKVNSKELEKGWILKADSLEKLAEQIHQLPNNAARMTSGILVETVKCWNDTVANGRDVDFNRHPETMMPIHTPPFYAMESWPIVTNTQGGPEHNEKRQVLEVLKRLLVTLPELEPHRHLAIITLEWTQVHAPHGS